MKKIVSLLCALALAAVLAIPAFAATEADIISALQAGNAPADLVSQAQRYLDAVDLTADTVDTVVSKINEGAALYNSGSPTKAQAERIAQLAQEAATAVNSDPNVPEAHRVYVNVTVAGNSMSVSVASKDGAGQIMSGTMNKTFAGESGTDSGSDSGSSSNPVIKPTGVSINYTGMLAAALAMAAVLGGTVVYAGKKGLLAK